MHPRFPSVKSPHISPYSLSLFSAFSNLSLHSFAQCSSENNFPIPYRIVGSAFAIPSGPLAKEVTLEAVQPTATGPDQQQWQMLVETGRLDEYRPEDMLSFAGVSIASKMSA